MLLYYIYYCVKHGDCFLKKKFGDPDSDSSLCCDDPEIKKQCYYDYLGYLSLVDNKYKLFETNKELLKKQFDDYNDGYKFTYFENLILTKDIRELSILN